MRLKLISFDLDDTLARTDQRVRLEVSEGLQRLEKMGIQVVINSGRNAPYLAGLARGMGLENPILIGENGGVIFRPKGYFEKRLAEKMEDLKKLEKEVQAKFGDRVWIQPSSVQFTLFPHDQTLLPLLFDSVRDFLKGKEGRLTIYLHKTSLDVLPSTINKGKALKELLLELKIEKGEVAALGNSRNDLPMLEEVGLPIIIGEEIDFPGAKKFPTVCQALTFLEGVT